MMRLKRRECATENGMRCVVSREMCANINLSAPSMMCVCTGGVPLFRTVSQFSNGNNC